MLTACQHCQQPARHFVHVDGAVVGCLCCECTDLAMALVGGTVPEDEATRGLAAFRLDHFLTCGYSPPKQQEQPPNGNRI